jgi:hypothetical protein
MVMVRGHRSGSASQVPGVGGPDNGDSLIVLFFSMGGVSFHPGTYREHG